MASYNLFPGYIPHAEQIKFHESKARFKALTAGVRAGKTYAGAREFLWKIWEDRQNKKGILKYWVVAPTFELADVAMEEVATILNGGHPALAPVAPSKLIQSWNATKRVLILRGGNVVITFKSGHDPKKLVAQGLDGVWLDEPARLKPAAWQEGIRQRLSDRVGWAIFSTTPLGTNNWYYTEIYRRGNPNSEIYNSDYANFHFKTADNTAVAALRAEVEKARKELPPVYFRREYEASFDDFVGQVYEELSDDVHRFADIPPGVDLVKFAAGMDFGWKQGALVVLGKGDDDKWYVIEEVVKAHMYVAADKGSANTWAAEFERIQRKYRNITFWCDSEDPEAISQLRRENISAMKASKAVLLGIERVAFLSHVNPDSGESRLMISKSCPHTWSQMRSYRWKDFQGSLVDAPASNQEDHAPDAVRYALYSEYKNGDMDIMQVTGWA